MFQLYNDSPRQWCRGQSSWVLQVIIIFSFSLSISLWRLIPNNTQCPSNCSYYKDFNEEEIWCFKHGGVNINYTECTKCPGTLIDRSLVTPNRYILKGDWGYLEPCPVDPEKMIKEKNLSTPMIKTLRDRYEGQILELQTFSEDLTALNDIINNITIEKNNIRATSKFFTCSSFLELLSRNFDDDDGLDLEFKRQVEYSSYFWFLTI